LKTKKKKPYSIGGSGGGDDSSSSSSSSSSDNGRGSGKSILNIPFIVDTNQRGKHRYSGAWSKDKHKTRMKLDISQFPELRERTPWVDYNIQGKRPLPFPGSVFGQDLPNIILELETLWRNRR
jgi:hypothetical protein